MEERDARHAVAAKRQEIDSVQLVISRMKNANSIGEIEERVITFGVILLFFLLNLFLLMM